MGIAELRGNSHGDRFVQDRHQAQVGWFLRCVHQENAGGQKEWKGDPCADMRRLERLLGANEIDDVVQKLDHRWCLIGGCKAKDARACLAQRWRPGAQKEAEYVHRMQRRVWGEAANVSGQPKEDVLGDAQLDWLLDAEAAGVAKAAKGCGRRHLGGRAIEVAPQSICNATPRPAVSEATVPSG